MLTFYCHNYQTWREQNTHKIGQEHDEQHQSGQLEHIKTVKETGIAYGTMTTHIKHAQYQQFIHIYSYSNYTMKYSCCLSLSLGIFIFDDKPLSSILRCTDSI